MKNSAFPRERRKLLLLIIANISSMVVFGRCYALNLGHLPSIG